MSETIFNCGVRFGSHVEHTTIRETAKRKMCEGKMKGDGKIEVEMDVRKGRN